MSTITIVATITAKPAHQATVEQALLALVTASRQDAGCLQYDLHRDRQQPHVFVFYENWQSQVLLDAHMQTKHLQDFQQQMADLVDSVDMKLLQRIA